MYISGMALRITLSLGVATPPPPPYLWRFNGRVVSMLDFLRLLKENSLRIVQCRFLDQNKHHLHTMTHPVDFRFRSIELPCCQSTKIKASSKTRRYRQTATSSLRLDCDPSFQTCDFSEEPSV